jgi:hypothetical protein
MHTFKSPRCADREQKAGVLNEIVQVLSDSIVDRLGSFYAPHSTLVKTLGAGPLGAVMSHMNQLQRS